MNHQIETSLSEDVLENLELAHDFLCRSQFDDRYWKWFIQALHSSAQGAAAMALDRGDGFLVQKPCVMKEMLAAHDAKATPVEPYMDSFLGLIQKSLIGSNLRSSAVPLEDRGHVAALKFVKEQRDLFVHFNDSGHEVDLAQVLNAAILVVLYIEHYAILTPAILWYEESYEQRSAAAIENLKEQIEKQVRGTTRAT
jgi:hypothetical protein